MEHAHEDRLTRARWRELKGMRCGIIAILVFLIPVAAIGEDRSGLARETLSNAGVADGLAGKA